MMVMPWQGFLAFIVVDGNVWSKQSLSVRSKSNSVSINKVSMMIQYQSLINAPWICDNHQPDEVQTHSSLAAICLSFLSEIELPDAISTSLMIVLTQLLGRRHKGQIDLVIDMEKVQGIEKADGFGVLTSPWLNDNRCSMWSWLKNHSGNFKVQNWNCLVASMYLYYHHHHLGYNNFQFCSVDCDWLPTWWVNPGNFIVELLTKIHFAEKILLLIDSYSGSSEALWRISCLPASATVHYGDTQLTDGLNG